jgi:ABC-2 type transport system permease protein
VRWLALKDLRILGRSPLLVVTLLLYPAIVALLIGLALSRGPDQPKVAVLNEVPAEDRSIAVGPATIDTARYADEIFSAVDAVPVEDREEAREKVENGEVLAAIIVPRDVPERLRSAINLSGGEPPEIEVIYNAGDPLKSNYVESLIDSKVADANRVLQQRVTEISAGYLDILLNGGSFSVLGDDFEVLGLKRSKEVIDASLGELPPDSEQKESLEQVSKFAGLAIDNLDLSDQVLAAVAEPVRVRREVLGGRDTPLESFAVGVAAIVSLMLVTLLLASGLLALERQDNTLRRLIRGLVRPGVLLTEKALVAGACGTVVALLLLAVVGIFVPLEWGRFGLWAVAVAAGAAAFGALGVALGVVAREVQAASLLAFVLSLPLAFLAIVPEGSVSAALYDVISVISALFPFEPALDALSAALSDGAMGANLLHLALLAAAYGVVARVALGRVR